MIPAGSKLVFQMHYTPNGVPAQDISSVGFKFVDRDKVKKLVGTVDIVNDDFRIPPGAPDHEVKAKRRIGRDMLILNLFPHMHLRGKSFRYTAKYPDGTSEILLDVPNYDFNWQNGYHLKQPKLIRPAPWYSVWPTSIIRKTTLPTRIQRRPFAGAIKRLTK